MVHPTDMQIRKSSPDSILHTSVRGAVRIATVCISKLPKHLSPPPKPPLAAFVSPLVPPSCLPFATSSHAQRPTPQGQPVGTAKYR